MLAVYIIWNYLRAMLLQEDYFGTAFHLWRGSRERGKRCYGCQNLGRINVLKMSSMTGVKMYLRSRYREILAHRVIIKEQWWEWAPCQGGGQLRLNASVFRQQHNTWLFQLLILVLSLIWGSFFNFKVNIVFGDRTTNKQCFYMELSFWGCPP